MGDQKLCKSMQRSLKDLEWKERSFLHFVKPFDRLLFIFFDFLFYKVAEVYSWGHSFQVNFHFM